MEKTISTITENIDLELWLERKNLSLFVTTLFQFLEGPKMKGIIGGGFTKEISIIRSGTTYYLKPINEINNLPLIHKEFISSTDIKTLTRIIDRAMEVYNSSDGIIQKIENVTSDEFGRNIKTFLSNFYDILLYTTSIPYFLIDAVEQEGTEKEKYELVYAKCVQLRGDSKYVRLKNAFLPKLVSFLATQYSMKPEEAANITYDELETLLNGDELQKDKDISTRNELSLCWLDFKTMKHHFTYDKATIEYFIKKYIEINTEGIKEIRGNIANKGLVKGQVVIVNTPDELYKVREGDIIVSRNTNPSLMPALILCGGIVTDEGGVACHAAIVSRELNKPCIIGTKIATRVIKDGDMVEVNANEGIVRILK